MQSASSSLHAETYIHIYFGLRALLRFCVFVCSIVLVCNFLFVCVCVCVICARHRPPAFAFVSFEHYDDARDAVEGRGILSLLSSRVHSYTRTREFPQYAACSQGTGHAVRWPLESLDLQTVYIAQPHARTYAPSPTHSNSHTHHPTNTLLKVRPMSLRPNAYISIWIASDVDWRTAASGFRCSHSPQSQPY